MSTTTSMLPSKTPAVANNSTNLSLPRKSQFTDRAVRCQNLAKDHPFASYLTFCAALARQQHLELEEFPSLPLPDDTLLGHCREHAMPPLAPAGWPPHPHWQEVLHRLIAAGRPHLPSEGQKTLEKCPVNNPSWLDDQQKQYLRGKHQLVDTAIAPFLGAALQVQWSALAARLPVSATGRTPQQPLCPVCGSHPVAAIFVSNSPPRGHYTLHCALCGCQWGMPRAQCGHCGNTKNMDLFCFSDHLPHIHAQSCPECKSYIKLIGKETKTRPDPMADDLASLALDLHMEGKKYTKRTINLFLPSPQR